LVESILIILLYGIAVSEVRNGKIKKVTYSDFLFLIKIIP